MRKIFAIVLFLFITTTLFGQAQKIKISSVIIEGNTGAAASSIRLNSGLSAGMLITGEDIQTAIKNLWALEIFEDIQVFAQNQSLQGIEILIRVKEYPRLNKVIFTGNDELEESELKEGVYTYPGMIVTPFKISNMKTQFLKKYHEEGYLLAKIDIDTSKSIKNRININVDINEGAEVQVEKITFHGNENIEDDDLKDAMDEIQEDRFWRSADFDPEKFKADKKLIIQYYKENGFRDAEILKDSLYYSADNEDLFIDIWVNEGNQYIFGDINFEGNEIFEDAELRSVFGVSKGETYDQKKYDEGLRDRLQKLYYNQGYLFANITPKETPVGNDTLDITFNIIESNVVRIKEIIITGNTKTNEKVIRRELKLRPGDKFNSAKLERSHRDLTILNYFGAIVPDVKLIPGDSKNVNLKIDVQEKSTDTANMSAGYSQRDGFIGSLGLTLNNFSTSHPLKGGDGQRLSIDWQFGTIYRSLSLSLTEPWLFDTPTLAGFSVFSTRTGGGFYPWIRRDQGGSIRLGRRFKWPDNYFRGDIIFRVAETSIEQRTVSDDERDFDDKTSQISITQIISRDSKNNPEFPTFGSSNTLSVELSGGPLGGQQHFVKTSFTSEWYIPLPFNLVLFSNSKMGIIKKLKKNTNILFGEYFYMGGSGLGFAEGLRGYEDGQVGPLSSSNRPLGGTAMSKATLELRFPIAPNPTIFGLFFVEAGNVWDTIGEFNPFEMKRSAGAGVRLFMPLVGIIGLDFGYGFDYVDIYGNRSGKWKVHFQFGRF